MMATQIANTFEVAEAELAYLVLNYLDERGWTKTSGSMKREAKDLLRAGSQRFAVGTIPKPLATIVSEYLQLTHKETQRTMLQRINPLAQSMYSLLDYTAGGAAMGTVSVNNDSTALPSTNGHMLYPQQQQQQQQQQHQLQMMYPPPQQHLLQPHQPLLIPNNGVGVIDGAGTGIHMVPMGALGNNQVHQQRQHRTQQRQPPLTPGGRHAQRKGAPRKRRRLDNDFETTLPYGGTNMHPPLDPSTIDPLNTREYSLFDDFSLDFLKGAVDPQAVMHFSNLLADNINKTQQETEGEDYGLTDTLLEDPESAEFLNKFVSAHNTHPLVDPDFRFTTFGGPPAHPAAAAGDGDGDVAMPPPPQHLPAQGKPSPARRSTRQRGQLQHPIPMSPLGGSRLGKRKKTPVKKVAPRRDAGGSGTRDDRSPAAEKDVKGNAGDKIAVADEIAEYLKKPDDFEDLINACVG